MLPAARALNLVLADVPDGPVIGPDHPDLAGNKYGFEGGRFLREADGWHAFMAELAGDPFNVRMRLAHWASPDLHQWRRVGTLYETDGSVTPGDPRFSLWSPMPVFNDDEQRWNLFYVAYTPGEGRLHALHTCGRIWRAVSTAPGRAGLGGPYRDDGIVLQPDADSEWWEGQQATDSFCPWRAGDAWYSFYGGHNYEPPGPWPVGLARAPALAGPWRRCPELNPSPIEPVFVENPIVTRVDADYVAVYDNCTPGDGFAYGAEGRHVGYAVSADGIHWPRGGSLAVQPPSGPAQWSDDIRTPLGLIAEADGTYSMLYTGKLRGQQFWAVGLARFRRT